METLKIPFYVRVALIAVAAYILVYAIYLGQEILIPIVYATILAILLNPVVNFLVRRRVNRVVAIGLAVLLLLLIIGLLGLFLSTQASVFRDTYPQLKVKLDHASAELTSWALTNFGIKIEKFNTYFNKIRDEAFSGAGGMVGSTLVSASSVVIDMLLLPVYIIMILYYKPLLQEVIRQLFRASHQGTLEEVMTGTKTIIQAYLIGLLIEALIIAVLNSAGLLILGIDYAIILGVTGAILNVIPYIGGILAIALPMIIALVTKDSLTSPLLVLGVYLLIQFVDNHYVIPRVVASKVKINALISIIAVLVGKALWGFAGMFLAIPLTAILKIIFDHIEGLKPWGLLLSDSMPIAKKPTILASNAIK